MSIRVLRVERRRTRSASVVLLRLARAGSWLSQGTAGGTPGADDTAAEEGDMYRRSQAGGAQAGPQACSAVRRCAVPSLHQAADRNRKHAEFGQPPVCLQLCHRKSGMTHCLSQIQEAESDLSGDVGWCECREIMLNSVSGIALASVFQFT
jgi:hypothetical protein